MPFLVRWPGQVRPGSASDQLVSLVDLMATCAEVVGAKLPDNAGEDSVSILPALRATADKPLREALVHHSISGRFAIRQGPMEAGALSRQRGLEFAARPTGDQAGLAASATVRPDPGHREQRNLQAEHPEVVERLTKLLERYVADGRSTPGTPQRNEVKIDLWKK